MNSLLDVVISVLRVDSIWSIVIRAAIWLFFVTIFAVGVSQGKQHTKIKAEAGFFILFLILTGLTIYMTFGFIPTLTNPATKDKNLP